MSNPRVYIALTTFSPLVGGAETQTHAQAQKLRERGYEVTVVTFRHNKAWLSWEMLEGVPVMRVAGALLGNREKLPRLLQKLAYLIAMLVMSWRLWQQRQQYDILQVCQFSLLVLPLALLCRLINKPMAIVLISAGAGKATKTDASATLLAGDLDTSMPWLEVDGQTWVDGDLYGIESAGKIVISYVRSLLQRIDPVIIVLSSRMKQYLIEHGFALPNTQLISNGVDIMRFHSLPADLLFKGRTQTVVCVAKLRYEKGIDVLLHAWCLVHKQLPTAQLVIVGDGPLRSQLMCMAQALGIAENVDFAGLHDDIPVQLHRGSIAVLPSRWEGMPNALLEAMASGLACVATRVSGSEDLIQQGVNGLLVEVEDYQSMAEELLCLLHDPLLSYKYGQAARATVEAHYSLDSIIEKYIAVYQKLIACYKIPIAIAEH